MIYRLELEIGTHTALIPLFDHDLRPILVQPDPESIQLVLQDREIVQRLEDVEDDEDEVAGSGDYYNSEGSDGSKHIVTGRGRVAFDRGDKTVPAMTCLPRPFPSFAP